MKATDRRARLPRPERCCKSYARSIQISAAMRLARSHFRGKAGIVIGSVARGDNVPTSDLDLLILTTSKARLTSYYSIPSVVKTTPPISIITYTPRDFKKFWDEGSLFVYHVLTEGMVAWDDGTLARLLRHPFKLKLDFSADIAIQIKRLKMFRDPRAFDGVFMYAFAELFKIYKNIVFFTLAQMGTRNSTRKRESRDFIGSDQTLCISDRCWPRWSLTIWRACEGPLQCPLPVLKLRPKSLHALLELWRSSARQCDDSIPTPSHALLARPSQAFSFSNSR